MESEGQTGIPLKARHSGIKFKSTLWLLFLLVVVAVLNFVSPCDGRGSNLFTIVYKKIRGTYVQNIFDTIPFVFSSSNITVLSTEEIQFTFAANHPSKIVCITERSDIDGWRLSFVETETNRFYFHSDKVYTPIVPMDVEIGESSRLFCKVYDLGVVEKPFYVFTSDPFVLRFSTLKLQYVNREESTVHFEVLPKHFYIESQNATAGFESGEIEMVCSCNPLFEPAGENKQIITMRGFLPLYFDIRESEWNRFEVSCQLFSVQYQHLLVSQPLSVVIAPLSSESPVI